MPQSEIARFVTKGLLAVLCVGAAAGAIKLGKHMRDAAISLKVERARQNVDAVSEALMQWDIDVKTPLTPDEGNYFAWHFLTTPIAYIAGASTPLRDPFSPSGEEIRFVTSPEGHYGGFAIIASRGPDGDWDIDRLPMREEIYANAIASPNAKSTSIVFIWGDGRPDEMAVKPGLPYPRVLAFTMQSGEVVDGRKISVISLPPRMEIAQRLRTVPIEPARLEFLVELGVLPYDPTNGLVSDGDLMAFYPEYGHYEKRRSSTSKETGMSVSKAR